MKARVAIVGAGIAGLASAAWLREDHGIDDLVVIEGSSRAGGKIRSSVDRGYTLEWGPQGFLDNAPDTLELVARYGLDEALVQADDASNDRFILRTGKLRRVSTSPIAFMLSGVLSLSGRLRLLGEPFARHRPDRDESVFDFACRRIGREAAEVLVDAMVTGVFAGDSRELSLAATFPKMAAMEAAHGSLTRALLAKRSEAKRSGHPGGGPAGPSGRLTTFEGGMTRLADRLAAALGDRLLLDTPVTRLRRRSRGILIEGRDRVIEANEVLLALPARGAADLLRELAPQVREPLAAIPTAPIAVVMTAYEGPDPFPLPPRGFGFLVPRGEEPDLLGTLFCHDIFPNQAPSGAFLLRSMIGGSRSPESARAPDDQLLTTARAALARVLGDSPEPDHSWVVKWANGISQYTIGHLERVTAAEEGAAAAGIELVGSAYRGVSVNDCVKQARLVAARVAGRIRS